MMRKMQERFPSSSLSSPSSRFNLFVDKLFRDGEWADEPMIQALVKALGVTLKIYRSDCTVVVFTPDGGSKIEIAVGYRQGVHYDSIVSITSPASPSCISDSECLKAVVDPALSYDPHDSGFAALLTPATGAAGATTAAVAGFVGGHFSQQQQLLSDPDVAARATVALPVPATSEGSTTAAMAPQVTSRSVKCCCKGCTTMVTDVPLHELNSTVCTSCEFGVDMNYCDIHRDHEVHRAHLLCFYPGCIVPYYGACKDCPMVGNTTPY